MNRNNFKSLLTFMKVDLEKIGKELSELDNDIKNYDELNHEGELFKGWSEEEVKVLFDKLNLLEVISERDIHWPILDLKLAAKAHLNMTKIKVLPETAQTEVKNIMKILDNLSPNQQELLKNYLKDDPK